MTVRARVWIESVLAVVFGLLFLLTLVLPDWIEVVFGADPDGGNGQAEWGFVALAGILSLGFAVLARFEWRRARRLGSAVR